MRRRWLRLGSVIVAGALLIGAGVLVVRARTVSQARVIALEGIGRRGSDWYAADLLGYVAVLTHSDGYTRSALADTLAEERRGVLPGTAAVIDVAVSSDGKLALVSDAHEGVGLWHLDRDPEVNRHNLKGVRSTVLDPDFGPVALSSDGRIAVLGDEESGDLAMWDLTGEPKRTAVRTGDYTESLLDVALSADGTTLVAGFGDGSVEVWRLGTEGKPRLLARVREHGSEVSVVSASADGKKLLTVSPDAALVWSLADPSHPVAKIAARATGGGGGMSADGRRAIIDRTVWDVTDPARPTRIGTLPGPAGGGTPTVVAGDGRTAATIESEPDGVSAIAPVTIWGLKDPAHPIRLATLRVPESQAWLPAMSGDGTVIVAGTRAGGAYSWLLPKLRSDLIGDACADSELLRPPPGYWEKISGTEPPGLLSEEPFDLCSRLRPQSFLPADS